VGKKRRRRGLSVKSRTDENFPKPEFQPPHEGGPLQKSRNSDEKADQEGVKKIGKKKSIPAGLRLDRNGGTKRKKKGAGRFPSGKSQAAGPMWLEIRVGREREKRHHIRNISQACGG